MGRAFQATRAAELWRLPRDDGPMKRRLRVSPVAAALTAALAPVWAGAAAIVIETAIAQAAPAGSAAAKERLCTSCHGRNGVPADHTVPIISGQQSAYLRKQLSDYRNGDRASQIMSSIAESLSEREIARIADDFAGIEWPEQAAAAEPAPPAIAACKPCHNASLTGGMSASGIAPRLAGQMAPYLIDTMTAYADGERANSTQMSALMRSLPPADRKSGRQLLGRPALILEAEHSRGRLRNPEGNLQ